VGVNTGEVVVRSIQTGAHTEYTLIGHCRFHLAQLTQVIKQDFNGVPEDVTRKIVCDNAAKLYQIDLN